MQETSGVVCTHLWNFGGKDYENNNSERQSQKELEYGHAAERSEKRGRIGRRGGFDLSYTGCRSCLACKRKGAERCKCFWKDDLSPVIDRIFAADALIIGSPIYLGDITSQVRGLIERLHFCALSYDDYSNYFTGKVNVGIILTMNAPKAFYKLAYGKKAKEVAQSFKALNGAVEVYASCDTLQVADYSKYDMASFSEEHKREVREKQFPLDMEKAFEMGARLSGGK